MRTSGEANSRLAQTPRHGTSRTHLSPFCSACPRRAGHRLTQVIALVQYYNCLLSLSKPTDNVQEGRLLVKALMDAFSNVSSKDSRVRVWTRSHPFPYITAKNRLTALGPGEGETSLCLPVCGHGDRSAVPPPLYCCLFAADTSREWEL